MTCRLNEHEKVVNRAYYLEIDVVIDPAYTRKWINKGLMSTPNKNAKKVNLLYIDIV